MDTTEALSSHFEYLNGLDLKEENKIRQRAYLLKIIANIKNKNETFEEFKTYYINELNLISIEISTLGERMKRYRGDEIIDIVRPIRCPEIRPSLSTWGQYYKLLDEVCSKLTYEIAKDEKNLRPFSQILFNLMSLYTHVCTSLADLSRIDKETKFQVAVLDDRINYFFKTAPGQNKGRTCCC